MKLPDPRLLRPALLILTAALAWESALAQRVRLGTLAPKGSSYYNEIRKMGEEWREGARGKVSLTVYPSGSLGGEAQMVRSMRLGGLQACLLTAVGLSEIEPSVSGLQNLPMMFEDLAEVDHVNARLQPLLEERLLEKGFRVLFWANAGWVHFFSTVPATSPDDFRKLKIFTWAGSPETVEIYRGAGFHPVPLETREIPTGLQTGLITAVPLPPFVANATQVDARAGHMLDLNWAPLVGALVITTRSWDRMDESARGLLEESAAECGKRIQAIGRKEASDSIEAMKLRGLEVRAPSPSEREAWRQAARKAYPLIRGKVVPEEIFDQVGRLVEEYRGR